MSAIICSCSRFAAPSGVTAATSAIATRSVVSRRMLPYSTIEGPLLRSDDEVRAPVLRPRRLIVPRVEWEFLAVADRLYTIRGNPKRQEICARRNRAALAECEVVFRSAALVAVAFDRDLPRGVPFQHFRVGLQHLLPRGIDLVRIEREEHGLERRIPVEVVQRLGP